MPGNKKSRFEPEDFFFYFSSQDKSRCLKCFVWKNCVLKQNIWDASYEWLFRGTGLALTYYHRKRSCFVRPPRSWFSKYVVKCVPDCNSTSVGCQKFFRLNTLDEIIFLFKPKKYVFFSKIVKQSLLDNIPADKGTHVINSMQANSITTHTVIFENVTIKE